MVSLGRHLMSELMAIGEAHGHRLVAQGPGPVFFCRFLDEGGVATYRDHLRADHSGYAQFAARMLEQGIRLIPSGRWYLTCAHTQADIDRTLDAADRVLAGLAR
jgi:glutamate-1-semialdehyde 2,1-aminomutase